MKARVFYAKTGAEVAFAIEAWATENEVTVRHVGYARADGISEAIVLYVDGKAPEPADVDGLLAAWKADVFGPEPKVGGTL